MTQDIPVLIIVFNRSWHLSKVMDALRAIRPTRLFVAGDGPRKDHPGEEQLCCEARKAVTDAIDWPCSLQTRFQTENQGCGKHVTGAVDWFFENVTEGIILEDDCVPSADFFRFSEELLERYRNSEEIMMLSGTALVKAASPSPYDYDFLSFPCCWGWATWRRAWQKMSYDMPDFPQYKSSGAIKRSFSSPRVQKRLLELFCKVYSHAPGFDTWDFQWLYACVKNGGVCILPSSNLVSNVGWDASHTRIDDVMEMPFESISDLRHPPEIRRNLELEQIFFERIYAKAPFMVRLFNKLKKIFSGEKH